MAYYHDMNGLLALSRCDVDATIVLLDNDGGGIFRLLPIAEFDSVFEQFATLDGISNGRAEIMAGRGSFIESFPLFGYDLSDYEILFEEKIDLFQCSGVRQQKLRNS